MLILIGNVILHIGIKIIYGKHKYKSVGGVWKRHQAAGKFVLSGERVLIIVKYTCFLRNFFESTAFFFCDSGKTSKLISVWIVHNFLVFKENMGGLAEWKRKCGWGKFFSQKIDLDWSLVGRQTGQTICKCLEIRLAHKGESGSVNGIQRIIQMRDIGCIVGIYGRKNLFSQNLIAVLECEKPYNNQWKNET